MLPEYSSRVTQFLGGNLDAVGPDGADVIRIMDGIRGVQLVTETDRSVTMIWFSGRDPSAPWRDPRVRRVVSMAMAASSSPADRAPSRRAASGRCRGPHHRPGPPQRGGLPGGRPPQLIPLLPKANAGGCAGICSPNCRLKTTALPVKHPTRVRGPDRWQGCCPSRMAGAAYRTAPKALLIRVGIVSAAGDGGKGAAGPGLSEPALVGT